MKTVGEAPHACKQARSTPSRKISLEDTGTLRVIFARSFQEILASLFMTPSAILPGQHWAKWRAQTLLGL